MTWLEKQDGGTENDDEKAGGRLKRLDHKKEDAIDREKWCDAVKKISEWHEANHVTSANGYKTGF